MTTGLVYHDRCMDHRTGPGHPERPERLAAVMERLRGLPLWGQLTHLSPTPAPLPAIAAVHDPLYIQRLREACLQCRGRGQGHIDCGDSVVCAESFDIALLAAGGTMAAVDAVMRGPGAIDPITNQRGVHNAFCALRPPGHHAERDRSMGFCLFNNIAVAARHLLDHHHLSRIAIVDFDVHHGNGTQHIFEYVPEVLFISVHEHPSYLYPGSGFAWEKGQEAGDGFTLNVPLDPGADDRAYRRAFVQQMLPALDRFSPEFLLVSAGFDASEHDPLAHMKVTSEGFTWMARQLKMAAERHCGGRLVSCLEGGYNLRALAENVTNHIGILLQPEGHDDLMAMKAGM